MKEALKESKDAVVSDLDTAEVLQPGVGAFDFPSLAIASQLPFVFKTPVADVLSIGSDQLRSTLLELSAQWVGVVASIGNHATQTGTGASASSSWNPHLLERAFCEPAFGNLRGRKLHSDRYAVAVDRHHALRTFPATGFADRQAPFFAMMNVASRKASSQSNNRCWSSIDNSFRHAANQTPSSSHFRSRRQQVEPSGYCSGRSRHLAPVRRTHRIPSRQERFDDQGRPRPSLRRLGAGNSGSNIFHCSSLNSSSRFFCLMTEGQQIIGITRKYPS